MDHSGMETNVNIIDMDSCSRKRRREVNRCQVEFGLNSQEDNIAWSSVPVYAYILIKSVIYRGGSKHVGSCRLTI